MKTCNGTRIIEQYLQPYVFADQYRWNVISRITGKVSVECRTEEEALAMLFWKSSFIEPPLNREEMLYCRAMLRIFYATGRIKIGGLQTVLEILEIPAEKMSLPTEQLFKAVKRAYWDRFNRLFNGLKSSFVNAGEIAAITKAFNFISR